MAVMARHSVWLEEMKCVVGVSGICWSLPLDGEECSGPCFKILLDEVVAMDSELNVQARCLSLGLMRARRKRW
jgi:hypothetical protein